MAEKQLSELEAMVLGLISTEGPCTAYAVRQTVKASLSAQWSGSAGAVYPAVARLQERGLIRSRAQATGRRQSQALRVTAAGSRALAQWLAPPIAEVALGIAPDPLRLRLRFLALLSKKERHAFIELSIESLEAVVTAVQADVRRLQRQDGDVYETAMARGALYATHARLRMLTELRAALSDVAASSSR